MITCEESVEMSTDRLSDDIVVHSNIPVAGLGGATVLLLFTSEVVLHFGIELLCGLWLSASTAAGTASFSLSLALLAAGTTVVCLWSSDWLGLGLSLVGWLGSDALAERLRGQDNRSLFGIDENLDLGLLVK